MSRTGDELLVDFSSFLEDNWASETDGAGSTDKSTLVDTDIAEYGSDSLVGGYIRITEPAHADLYTVHRVREFDADSGGARVETPFSTQIVSGVTYEFHRHDPRKKLSAINRARLLAFPQVSRVVLDETRTGDGYSNQVPLPADMRTGPIQVWGECPIGVGQSWNFLPQTGWTAGAGSTLATYTSNSSDPVIPRRQASCSLWTITGASETTLSLTAAVLAHSLTAASLAGRRVTVGVWAYCRVANRISLRVTDDSGASNATASHQGQGWEFLTLTLNVAPANATTFTVALVASAGAADVMVAVEETYGIYGDYIPLDYSYPLSEKGVLRDGATGVLYLDEVPQRGQQLRLVGRKPLSDMGSTHAAQSVASLEIDVQNQELLFAKAARLLYTGEGLTAGQVEAQFPKITEVEGRFKEQAKNWEVRLPFSDSVKVWS